MSLLPPIIAICLLGFVVCFPAWGNPPTLEQLTAEQDWIARSPQNPRWTIDGQQIMYSSRRAGAVGRTLRDSYLIDVDQLDSDAVKVTPDIPGPYFTGSGDWDSGSQRCLLTHSGDVFLYSAMDDSVTQLTRTTTNESRAFFLFGDQRYAFWRDGHWYTRSIRGGMELQAADIRFDEAPEDEEEKELEYLEQQQRDLFVVVSRADELKKIKEEDTKAWRDTNPTSVAGPFYLGEDNKSGGISLSPTGNYMMVVTAPAKSADDPKDVMPSYVTDDGYVSSSHVRSKVGNSTETPNEFVLLDLQNERVIELDLSTLPMIDDDPLAWLKVANENASPDESDEEINSREDVESTDNETEAEGDPEDKPAHRPVSHMGTRWDDTGRYAAIMLLSHDNKDRWIAMIDTADEEPALINAHHLRDEAWVGWDFNSFGFVPESTTLWYLSEESGYGHLYTRTQEGEVAPMTAGKFEVRSLVFSRDGTDAYLRTNRTHPGIQELEQLDLTTGQLNPIMSMRGTVESFRISPDESQAVLVYTNINSPPEFYLIDLAPGADPVRITSTVTEEFARVDLQAPMIVPVPSTHTEQDIYTRVYLPDASKFAGPRPLVLFSHGAGYTQHANYQWSYYSREHMYHTLLANLGFVVVAPDFRASSGYGRDWRTAIYRNMGYPELEDFQDTIDYAVDNYNADPNRVGIYGGSYGGFMTLMAMFLEPETYKAGAALRSVTDWAHYNHGYTSNILNTPEIDPESFQRSSPINHAEGLEGRLLMLHGLLDDNVVAQDIIRLSQRLIELEKENWELALAPIEPHGYQEPSSWLDQMRRIHKLFMEELADPED